MKRGLEQVGVAAGGVGRGSVGLELVQPLDRLGAAAEFMQHVGGPQLRGPALRSARHAGVPVQRLLVPVQEFGHLPEQQAPLRVGPRRFAPKLVVQRDQRGLVLRPSQ
ncbi:hypothetical protein SNE33_11850 [Lysobacter zhanggongensis]|uniref:Uncharacterized protein n=1 Tax=Lysobacter zhanggongensis TaxID=1774951 RepID=A0ABU7YSL9_9GAMM